MSGLLTTFMLLRYLLSKYNVGICTVHAAHKTGIRAFGLGASDIEYKQALCTSALFFLLHLLFHWHSDSVQSSLSPGAHRQIVCHSLPELSLTNEPRSELTAFLEAKATALL